MLYSEGIKNRSGPHHGDGRSVLVRRPRAEDYMLFTTIDIYIKLSDEEEDNSNDGSLLDRTRI